jgi:hypothetical protein
MKVTNWRKKIAAAILAAGIWTPGVASAINIPVPDGDFEAYDVAPHGNFAYAIAGGSYTGAYRPTSPWVDDKDHFSGAYIQDNASSNYLYNVAYANASGRGTPRAGGDTAMHGLHRYSAQVLTGQTFEAGQTYTLSAWAQDDISEASTEGVFMYLFDGSSTFSEATALAMVLYDDSAINDRTAGMSSLDSQNNWTPISLTYTPTGNAIGKPIGVGFFLRRGSAIDDVTLSSVPEPTSVLLVGMSGLAVLGMRRRK